MWGAVRAQKELERRLAEGLERGCFPSATAAVGIRKQVMAKAFIGEAPLPGGAPVGEHTRYDMASLSKVIGPTMIALKALEDGQLGLEETVGDFFPDAPADKRDITVEMLMTHTGGFHPSFRLDRMGIRPDQTRETILNRPLEAAPGTRVIYSCMGYILFAKMLERRFGQPMDTLARERVFEPLGMTETGYCPPAGVICAATEEDQETGKPWIGIVHDENARFQGGVSGNAGVFMPLQDAIIFAGMLAELGGDFLREETMREAIRCRTQDPEERRGLGFQLAGTDGCFFSPAVPEWAFGHTGFTGTSLMVEPESGFWVVLLTNRVYPTRENLKLMPFRRELHAAMWNGFSVE